MKIEIHPSAENNFNLKANELVRLVIEHPSVPIGNQGFKSDVPVVKTITDKDIIGSPDLSITNNLGQTVNRYFHINQKRFGLSEQNYAKVVDISENIQSLTALRSKVSSQFIENVLFTWIHNKFSNEKYTTIFIEELQNEIVQSVKPITTWIPIANLETEASFSVSNSEICSLSKDVLQEWENKLLSITPSKKANISKLFENIKAKFQGLAAVVTTLEAEPKHALQYTMLEAQRITSILGIFSAGVFVPNVRCASKVKGSENIAETTTFLHAGDYDFQMNSGIVAMSSNQFWRLSKDRISEIKNVALDKLSEMLNADSLNEYEDAILNSVLLYSKSAFTLDPVEKVVYILSALESIMLKNNTEPIQQNLAERFAVFSVDQLKERKEIIKSIKDVYGLRSRYLHHGQKSSELELVESFMLYVWKLFISLINQKNEFTTKIEFLNAIDDHKLS